MGGLEASLMIHAAENWGVAIFDVPGAYLWADVSKDKTV